DRQRQLVFAHVSYTRGDPELYAIPLAFYEGAPSEHALLKVEIRQSQTKGYIAECSHDPAVPQALMSVLLSGKRLRGANLQVSGAASPELKKLKGQLPEAHRLGAEQTNTSYVFGDRAVAKLLRLVEEGQSIELEVLEH